MSTNNKMVVLSCSNATCGFTVFTSKEYQKCPQCRKATLAASDTISFVTASVLDQLVDERAQVAARRDEEQKHARALSTMIVTMGLALPVEVLNEHVNEVIVTKSKDLVTDETSLRSWAKIVGGRNYGNVTSDQLATAAIDLVNHIVWVGDTDGPSMGITFQREWYQASTENTVMAQRFLSHLLDCLRSRSRTQAKTPNRRGEVRWFVQQRPTA